MEKLYPTLLFIALCLSILPCGNGQSTKAQIITGHYQYKYVIPYSVKEGAMLFSETGTMDFYDNGHGLDSARQVYRLITQDRDTVFWTFNYVNQNNWQVSGDTLLYSGTPATFIFELLDLRVTNPAMESWANNYGDYILRRIRETIGDTDTYTITRRRHRILLTPPSGETLKLRNANR